MTWASVAAADTVYLKDGEIIIGEILDQSSLLLTIRPKGEQSSRMISMDDVADVRESPAAPAAPEADPEADRAEAARAEAERLRAYTAMQKQSQEAEDAERARLLAEPASHVKVTLDGSPEVELHRKESIDGARVICRSPCGVTIDIRPSDTFEVGGPGVTGHDISLPIDVPSVRYRVDAGSSAARVGGIVAMSVGGAGALVGALFIVQAARSEGRIPEPTLIGGGVGIGVGVAAFGAGLTMMLTLGTTKVELMHDEASATLVLDASGGAPMLRF